MPVEISTGSSSLNLAGGFGDFEADDDAMLYNAPDVKRWAALAVYKRMDGLDDAQGNEIETGVYASTQIDNGTSLINNSGTEPAAFTSFGGQGFSGFGNDFHSDFDEDIEVGRAHAQDSRQSLGFETSPLRSNDKNGEAQQSLGTSELAPIDDTFGIDDNETNEFGNSSYGLLEEENPFGQETSTSNEKEKENKTPLAVAEKDVDKIAPIKRRRHKIKFDESTTMPRKALKMKEKIGASVAVVPLRERDLTIWNSNQHPILSQNISTALVESLWLQPVTGIFDNKFMNIYKRAVQGTLTLHTSGTDGRSPSKRSHGDISGIDDIEIARRKSRLSLGDVSAIDDQSAWDPDGDVSMMESFQAPIDDISFGLNSSNANVHKNAALEQALCRHNDSDVNSEDSKHVLESEDLLPPRTLVVMKEINKELGIKGNDIQDEKPANSKANSIRFDNMISGFRKAPAAAAFFEILALKTRGFIDVNQGMAFGGISLTSTGKFVDPTAT